MESTTTPSWEDDEWELCNDDGFVYKRRRTRNELDPSSDAGPAQPGSGPDPEAQEMGRRERKRKTLLKLKAQYQREIDHWVYLSNTLRAMEETTLQLQQRRRQTVPPDSSPLLEIPRTESVCGSLVEDLLLQVEAQEAIIRDASNLCDVAEAMCNAHEEEANQSLIDLPIWALPASPRELLASLCDQ
ncbi:cryptic loci regulator [Parasponia andersonii]|uniref:Cryptic loci regulator n=1 Tax=Parasponia andersonii TaxID=3476 RepID=A0A2P5AJA4_PARAD|nr:cryptic loci regulator [Parasponia andersonii]